MPILLGMSNLFLDIGSVRCNWMQHNLPWLSVLALFLGLAREGGPGMAETDSDNG